MKAVGKVLKNPNLSGEAITAGKNLLKLQILSEAEDGGSLSESLAATALAVGEGRSPTELAAAVDKLSASDVNSVSIKVLTPLSSLPNHNNNK